MKRLLSSLIFGAVLSVSCNAAKSHETRVSDSKIPYEKFKEGDLIFIVSTSTQSAALKEASGSDWTHVGMLFKKDDKWVVGEASRVVMLSPVEQFIRKSAGGTYAIRRLKKDVKTLGDSEISTLFETYKVYEGRPYDIYFQMVDSKEHKAQDLLYCSELTYLLYQSLGLEVGKREKFRNLNIGEESKKLVEKRFTKRNAIFDFNQPVVTPRSQFESTLLEDVVLVHGSTKNAKAQKARASE